VDLALGGLSGDHFFQKHHEFLARVPRCRLADDFTGLRIQCRKERQSAVAIRVFILHYFAYGLCAACARSGPCASLLHGGILFMKPNRKVAHRVGR
jgi:hypothetical protein